MPGLVRRACSGSPIVRQRQKVVPQATGRVLEVGIGSGYNLPFYDASRVTSVVGLDPTEALTVDARIMVEAVAFGVEIISGSAEAIPADAGSFDTVLVTWTLCTIPDVEAALAEVRRVLAPGGRLVFAEHGKAPDRSVQWMQDLLNPVWSRMSGGCNLNRPMPGLIERAGFELERVEAMYLPGPRWLNYHVWGSAFTP